MPIVKANGIDIYYEMHGDGSPLLLIMGTGGDHRAWAKILPLLAKKHRCIVFDNRGTGRSSKPETGYSMRILADDAAELLDALQIPSANVAGWSLGSTTALELAINHPSKVRSMALWATWDRPYAHFRRRFEIQIKLAKLGRPDLLTAFAVLTLFDPRFINENEEAVKAFEAVMYGSADDPVELRTPLHALLGHYDADIKHDVTGRLHRIAVPTLLVTGAVDPLTRPEYARATHEGIKGSELKLIEGADHMLPVTVPDKLAAITLDFFHRHADRR